MYVAYERGTVHTSEEYRRNEIVNFAVTSTNQIETDKMERVRERVKRKVPWHRMRARALIQRPKSGN